MRDFHLLKPFISKKRIERFNNVLEQRTRWITVVLDDLYHKHNMSAVLRSAEAFGIQDVHVVEISNAFKPAKGVALGTEQWITIYKYSSVEECVSALKQAGYKIFCAHPPPVNSNNLKSIKSSYSVHDLPVDSKIAVVFGRELDGLHEEFIELSHGTFFIPMKGLAESLNVSVCAALTIYELRNRMESVVDKSLWQLSEQEKLELLDRWILTSVKHGPSVLKEIKKRLAS